jgi:DNA-binding GntR family transcriptional regulator
MAADPAVSERVYQEIRKRLLAGAFRLREHLDVARLAGALSVSATPVREALTRLAAEGLVAARPARGFFATLWSQTELKSLYEWRAALALLALEMRGTNGEVEAGMGGQASYAERVAGLFRRIEAGVNPQLRRAAANADDRLHAARKVEPEALDGCEEELAALEQAVARGDRREIAKLIRRYHARRTARVSAIRERAVLRALPGNGE